MPPRDFSEDGAVGAGGGGMPSPGDAIGGMQVTDPGPGAAPPVDPTNGYTQHMVGTNGISDPGHYSSGPGGLKYTPLTAAEMAGSQAYTEGMINQTPGQYKSGPAGLYGPGTQYPGSFEEGGAVGEGGESPDDGGDDDQGALPKTMDGLQQSINRALETVDNALSYGRKLHGLPGGEDDGGLQQQAGAMPMIPGNQSESGLPPQRPGPRPPQRMAANYPMPMKPAGQSESGIPPLRPEPGRLPPTNNPFGKRADNDGDDDQGAIPDENEVA